MKIGLTSITTTFLLAALIFCSEFALQAQPINHLYLNTGSNTGKKSPDPNADQQLEFLKNLYSENLEKIREMINGKEYEPYYVRSDVKPLLLPEKKRRASLSTKTRLFENLTLEYDTFLDEIIFTDTSRTVNYRFPQISLNKDLIDGFVLYFDNGSMTFRNFRQPDCSALRLQEGFYEVAYEGKSSLLIQHRSTYYQKEGLDNYQYSPRFYISTGQGFYVIKSAKELLAMFGSKAHLVKAFMHSSRVKIRRADKDQIVSILKYYDSI